MSLSSVYQDDADMYGEVREEEEEDEESGGEEADLNCTLSAGGVCIIYSTIRFNNDNCSQ